MGNWELWVCRPVGCGHRRRRVTGKSIAFVVLVTCSLLSVAAVAGWQFSALQASQSLKAIQP